MPTPLLSLDDVRVALPCSVPWESMSGDGRVRFCSQCQRNVYNLSEMTAEAAKALVQEKEGRLCVRFYRRRDGTILTGDCPLGLLRLANRPWRWLVAAFAAIAAAAALGPPVESFRKDAVLGEMVPPVQPQKGPPDLAVPANNK